MPCSLARTGGHGTARPVREMLILAIHLLVTLAKLLRPGGVRAVAAESLLLKHDRPYLFPHHCFSQGTPSPPPSIFTPGQFARKNSASSQEVICEQCTRPSQ